MFIKKTLIAYTIEAEDKEEAENKADNLMASDQYLDADHYSETPCGYELDRVVTL